MSRTPEGLEGWALALAFLPRDVAEALAPAAARLALGIGPLPAPPAVGDGEPDGYADLSRRGPYTRLLASEWLLADEIPDEFVRRAVMHEHGFLALAVEQPRTSRGTLVLFDSGPDQLGAPRLAHLVAHAVFARRAAAAGASLEWGVIAGPLRLTSDGLRPFAVDVLLAARTRALATKDDVADWAAAARRDGIADQWIVCGSRAASWAQAEGFSTIVVEEGADAPPRSLTVTLRQARHGERRIELPLPHGNVQARAFEIGRTSTPAPARGTPRLEAEENVVFDPGGRRLHARLGRRQVISFPVPGRSLKHVGAVRISPRLDSDVLAVAQSGGTLWVIVKDANLRLVRLPLGSRRLAESRRDEPVPPLAEPLAPLILLGQNTELQESEAIFLDASGIVWRARPSRIHLALTDVTSLARVGALGWLAVVEGPAGTQLFSGSTGNGGPIAEPWRQPRRFLDGPDGLFAFEDTGRWMAGRWARETIGATGRRPLVLQEIRLPVGARPAALFRLLRGVRGPYIVGIGSDPRELIAYSTGVERVAWSAREPITGVVGSPIEQVVAVTTASGNVHVVDLDTSTIRWSLVPEDSGR